MDYRKPLGNTRKEVFALAVAQGVSEAKAYKKAFPRSAKWKDKTLRNRASELSHDRDVVGRVAAVREAAARTAVAGAQEVGEFLTGVMRADAEYRMPCLDKRGLPLIDPATGRAVFIGPALKDRISAADKLITLKGYEAPRQINLGNSGYAENYHGIPPGLAKATDEELRRIVNGDDKKHTTESEEA